MNERASNSDFDVEAGDPSLIDDVSFVASLDRLEVRGISRPVPPPPIARDANRWNLHPPPGRAPDPRDAPAFAPPSAVWMPVIVGLGAGAAASALVFHERLAQLLSLLAW